MPGSHESLGFQKTNEVTNPKKVGISSEMGQPLSLLTLRKVGPGGRFGDF